MSDAAGSSDTLSRVSLLGLGAMGRPMASVLQRAGVRLVVWNRTPARAEVFRSTGVQIAATPAEAAVDIVLTVLPDIADVRDVLLGDDGLLAGWRGAGIESPVLVVMGTVSPVAVRELAAELCGRGVRLVDAPLSGGVMGAAEARLSIMVGGSDGDVAELNPLFNHLGSVVRHMGPLGSGQLTKACNQLVVAATVTALSEAMVLARAAGLDPAVVQEILGGGLAASEVLTQKGAHWIEETFIAGGAARYQLKDLNFAQAAADELGIVLPLGSRLRELFGELVAAGDGDLDHTAVYRQLQRQSGRPVV